MRGSRSTICSAPLDCRFGLATVISCVPPVLSAPCPFPPLSLGVCAPFMEIVPSRSSQSKLLRTLLLSLQQYSSHSKLTPLISSTNIFHVQCQLLVCDKHHCRSFIEAPSAAATRDPQRSKPSPTTASSRGLPDLDPIHNTTTDPLDRCNS
jgi:hypothetical protein